MRQPLLHLQVTNYLLKQLLAGVLNASTEVSSLTFRLLVYKCKLRTLQYA